ncbi:MAG: hypothetical protein AAGJ80_16500, partial [Cyanobacteria bacterium J06553_1]
MEVAIGEEKGTNPDPGLLDMEDEEVPSGSGPETAMELHLDEGERENLISDSEVGIHPFFNPHQHGDLPNVPAGQDGGEGVAHPHMGDQGSAEPTIHPTDTSSIGQTPRDDFDNVFSDVPPESVEFETPEKFEFRMPDSNSIDDVVSLEEIDSQPIYVAGQNVATTTLLLQPSNGVKESLRGKKELSRLSRNNSTMETHVKQLGLVYHGQDGKRFNPTGMSKFSTSFDNMKCLCKGKHHIVKDQRLAILLTDDSLPPRLGYNSSCINVVRYLESSSFDDIKASLPLICNGLLKSPPPKVTFFLNFTNFLKDVDAHSAFQMCERIGRIIESLLGG